MAVKLVPLNTPGIFRQQGEPPEVVAAKPLALPQMAAGAFATCAKRL